MDKMPVLGKDSKLLPFVPMEILNEEWAQKIHGQSLNRLRERGGLCFSEIAANIDKREWKEMDQVSSMMTITRALLNLIVTKYSSDVYFAGSRFPSQDKPGLDLIMVELTDVFGSRSLDIHDTIVKIMDSKNIPLSNKDVRWALSKMAIQTYKKVK